MLMKKFVFLITLLVVLSNALVFAQEPQETSTADNIGIVKASGSAILRGDTRNAYAKALLIARRNSAEKALLRFIPADFTNNSLYLRLLAKFDCYVGREVKVYKTQKLNEKLILFCDVPVNFEFIQRTIKQEVTQQQKQNRRDKISFIVKLEGYPEAKVSDLEKQCLIHFEDAFREYNFRSLGLECAGPETMELLRNKRESGTYEEYRTRLLSSLQDQPEITLVLIGTIRLKRHEDTMPYFYAEAEGSFELLRLDETGERVLGKINEGFTALREDSDSALAAVTQAAAVKSSKHLASIIYNNWNLH